jgi:opacity protein-like surface antigen
MNKFLLALSLLLVTSVFASAQASDYKKGEFYIGYSNGQVDTGVDTGNTVNSFLRDRANFNGFEVAGVYNVSRYVGIKGDVSGTYNSSQFSFPVTTGTTTQTVTFDTKNSLYNFLGGVQIKDNANEGRFKPFAHALVGAGHGRTTVSNVTCTTTTSVDCSAIGRDSSTGLAMAFGGGLDIRVNDKVDLRAFQVDYNPIRFNGAFDNNVRFGIGIVIK